MKNKEPAESLHQDVLTRQRNVVYPDTIRNEAEGYRYLLSAPKLRRVQRIGAFIVGLLFALFGTAIVLTSFLLPRLVASEGNSRIGGVATIPLALVMVGTGLVFAALGLRLAKRTLRS